MSKQKICLIGAGPSNLMVAYKLSRLEGFEITLLDCGNPLESRICPIVAKKAKSCLNCSPCSIMKGFGGAGGFSDGKFIITNEYGGDVFRYVGEETALELMSEANNIYMSFLSGKTPRCFKTETSLNGEVIKHDIHLSKALIYHYGTDLNHEVLAGLFKDLTAHNVKFMFNCLVSDIRHLSDKFEVCYSSGVTETFDKVVLGTGRSGNDLVKTVCETLNLDRKSSKVDLGVRVELPSAIWDNITKTNYEAKLTYITKKYEDSVRTFCMNPNGRVVTENTNGLITVNGHSYEDSALKTENTNFALLVSFNFPDPFRDSAEYAANIIKLSNQLGKGPIVQRFVDLVNGHRTTASRLAKSFIKPTLNATMGDLSLVLPGRILTDVVEMIYKLDELAHGTAGNNTLLYGVEAKFYNNVVSVDSNFESAIKGLYIIGDGSGISHSFAHASAMGLQVAKSLS